MTPSAIPDRLVEVGRSFTQAFQPVLAFEDWRVAMLRAFDAVKPDKFWRVERHRKTNEIFILSEGRADLIILDGDETPHSPQVIPMDRSVAYNVRRGIWHHVVMTPDAHIVLFERSDTGPENSDYFELDRETVEMVRNTFTV